MNLNHFEPAGRRGALLAMALLLAAAFALFANTFGHTWTYDDFPVIVDNPDVRSIGAFLTDSYPGRPLRELTYLLDHALFGLEPAGWHIQSIFWHGLNAGLLFMLVSRLGGGSAVAWIAALLFLSHPLQVEAVANISHRKESLAVAFSLLSVLAYAQSFAADRRRGGWVAAAVGLWALACLGKQNAAVLPAVFLAYEWAFVPPPRRLLLRYKGVLGVALASGTAAALVWFGWYGGKDAYWRGMTALLHLKANHAGGIEAGVYIAMVLKSWAFMFLKFLLPVGLALEYTYPVPSSWLDPWVLAALAGAGLYGFSLWRTARSRPLAFFALVWLGAFWLPVANLWPLAYFAADRYLYGPSVGVFILAAPALAEVSHRSRLLGGATVALLLCLAVLTWQQNRVWRSEETLWVRAYEVSPQSAFALNNLGNIHLLRGELISASEYYSRAVSVNPANPTAHYNLGMISERVGKGSAALEHYGRFLALDDPTYSAQARALREHLKSRYGAVFD